MAVRWRLRPEISSRSARLVALALALLALAWLVTPAGRTPPLYDGLGFPDEAYRFVHAPAGYRSTAAPTAATRTVKLAGRTGDIFDIISDETGPQVEIFVDRRVITAPATATVTVAATPVATPTAATAALPDGQAVWGNVYRFGVTAAGRAVGLTTPPSTDSIRLRTPTGPPPTASIAYFDGRSWRVLQTERIGTDIYGAPLQGAGYYAALAPAGQLRYTDASPAPGAAAATGSGRGGVSPLVWIVGGAVVVLAAAVGAIRFSRRGGAKQ